MICERPQLVCSISDAVLKKQLKDVNYFITKANNLMYKSNMVLESHRVYWRRNLETLQDSIRTQFIFITSTLLELTDWALTWMD